MLKGCRQVKTGEGFQALLADANTALPRLTLLLLRNMGRTVKTAAQRAAKARPLEMMAVFIDA